MNPVQSADITIGPTLTDFVAGLDYSINRQSLISITAGTLTTNPIISEVDRMTGVSTTLGTLSIMPLTEFAAGLSFRDNLDDSSLWIVSNNGALYTADITTNTYEKRCSSVPSFRMDSIAWVSTGQFLYGTDATPPSNDLYVVDIDSILALPSNASPCPWVLSPCTLPSGNFRAMEDFVETTELVIINDDDAYILDPQTCSINTLAWNLDITNDNTFGLTVISECATQCITVADPANTPCDERCRDDIQRILKRSAREALATNLNIHGAYDRFNNWVAPTLIASDVIDLQITSYPGARRVDEWIDIAQSNLGCFTRRCNAVSTCADLLSIQADFLGFYRIYYNLNRFPFGAPIHKSPLDWDIASVEIYPESNCTKAYVTFEDIAIGTVPGESTDDGNDASFEIQVVHGYTWDDKLVGGMVSITPVVAGAFLDGALKLSFDGVPDSGDPLVQYIGIPIAHGTVRHSTATYDGNGNQLISLTTPSTDTATDIVLVPSMKQALSNNPMLTASLPYPQSQDWVYANTKPELPCISANLSFVFSFSVENPDLNVLGVDVESPGIPWYYFMYRPRAPTGLSPATTSALNALYEQDLALPFIKPGTNCELLNIGLSSPTDTTSGIIVPLSWPHPAEKQSLLDTYPLYPIFKNCLELNLTVPTDIRALQWWLYPNTDPAESHKFFQPISVCPQCTRYPCASESILGPDQDGDGRTMCNSVDSMRDCDDRDSFTFPGATEVCDGKDNSCSGLVDDSCI